VTIDSEARGDFASKFARLPLHVVEMYANVLMTCGRVVKRECGVDIGRLTRWGGVLRSLAAENRHGTRKKQYNAEYALERRYF
jgi:hypothetical protein